MTFILRSKTRTGSQYLKIPLAVCLTAVTVVGCGDGLSRDPSPATTRSEPAVPLTGPQTPEAASPQASGESPATPSADGKTNGSATGRSGSQPTLKPAAPSAAKPNGAGNKPAVSAASSGSSQQLNSEQVLSRLRTFADQYRSEIASACDRIKATRTDPSLRRKAHQYKLDASTAIYDIAAEPDPRQAVLDALVLVTLQWYAAEANAVADFPEDHQLVRDATRIVKESAWSLAAQVIDEKRRAELLQIIDRWWADNAGTSEVWYVRITDFAGYGKGTPFEGAFGAVTGLPGSLLNAFVPVGDATATLNDAQATAERITWLAPRLMILAQWRAEALIFETLATTEVERVLESTNRAVDAADRATTLAETLPAEIATQTGTVLDDLAENQESIRALLEETRATIGSVDGLAATSTAVLSESERTVQAADQLAGSVDRLLVTWKEIQAQSAQRDAAERAAADPDDEPGPPFNINEYTEALNAATRTIEETNRVLLNLQSVTEPNVLNDRLREVTDSGESFITHTTARLERLALVAAAGVAGAGILIVLAFKLVPSRRGAA